MRYIILIVHHLLPLLSLHLRLCPSLSMSLRLSVYACFCCSLFSADWSSRNRPAKSAATFVDFLAENKWRGNYAQLRRHHQASIRSFVDYTRQIVPTICHYEVILGLLGLYLLSCDSHIGRLKVRSVARIFFVQFV